MYQVKWLILSSPVYTQVFKKSTSISVTNQTVAEQSTSSEGMIEGDHYITWILFQLEIQHYLADTSVEGMHEYMHQDTDSVVLTIVGRKLMKLVI